MTLRKRGVTYQICFRKRGYEEGGRGGGEVGALIKGVPALEETMNWDLILQVVYRHRIFCFVYLMFMYGLFSEKQLLNKISKQLLLLLLSSTLSCIN